MNFTNVFNRGEGESVRLKKAILIYESERNQAVAMLHPVIYQEEGKKNGTRGSSSLREGVPVLGAGAGISMGELQRVIYALVAGEDGAQGKGTTFIGENVVALSMTMIAWWKPSHVGPMWMAGKRARDYSHPNLFFVGTPSSLSVWALKEGKRPGEGTELFNAPYWNVYGTGNMCRGNASYPTFITPKAIEVFEKAFFETNFTHPSHDQLIRRVGGVKGFWWELRGKRLKRVPTGGFVSAKLTVAQAIERATKEKV